MKKKKIQNRVSSCLIWYIDVAIIYFISIREAWHSVCAVVLTSTEKNRHPRIFSNTSLLVR